MTTPTKPQWRALKCLGAQRFATPQEIGYAMTVGRSPPLKPQGAGRLGGTMGSRLVRMELASHYSGHGGFPAYAITAAGRAKLREGETR